MRKILKWAGILLGGLIGLAVLTGLVLYPIGMRKLNRSYPDIPVEAVKIPRDSDAIARGKHVAIVWACTKCHGADLSGTLMAGDPFVGTIPAANLTSGRGGIARSYTDADWIRAIRHGVKPNSRGEAFMYDYATMSDRDLGALIAYLKQIPPVDSDYPALRFGPIAAVAPAVGLFTPAAELIDHSALRPADVVPSATAEYGRYLFSLCTECHSASLAGNVAKWKQEDFVRALRTGALPNGRQLGAAMPLTTYGEINDTELAALWIYLRNPARQ